MAEKEKAHEEKVAQVPKPDKGSTEPVPALTVHGVSKVQVRYLWKCTGCEVTAKAEQTLAEGDALAIPAPPAGWEQVEQDFYCPAHEIVLTVDGEPV